MRQRIARALATWFGAGYVPIAPGTAGSVAALPLYFLLRAAGGVWLVAAGAVVVTVVGIWSSSLVAGELGVSDPQIVVIDEVAGVLVALLTCPNDWRYALAGLVAFRVFDTLKPWPVHLLESELPGGYGIVLDDVGAGAYVAAIFAVLRAKGIIP